MGPPKTIFLVGPTAVGKSAVALEVTPRIGAEIVSADSMQIYRGMDIGTAKPSAIDRARVPHHLIDVVEFDKPFDVARYRVLALAAISNIHGRGKAALVVGGTGLYVRALTRGLDEIPRANAELRARLEAQPLEGLVVQLTARDPLAASKIDLSNKRRVVRALEVFELTGQSIVRLQGQWAAEPNQSRRSSSTGDPLVASLLIGLTRCRTDLYRRIEARVDAMFARGLVEEVRALLTRGLAGNPTAMQAVGYKEVAAHLRGEIPLEQCRQAVKIATRHLAKRQLTWFRRETNLQWIEVAENESVEQTTKRVWQAIETSREHD